jgi:hypothetical protein
VDSFGKDEKQQFTLMITPICLGEFLPVQYIWAAKQLPHYLKIMFEHQQKESVTYSLAEGTNTGVLLNVCKRYVSYSFNKAWT